MSTDSPKSCQEMLSDLAVERRITLHDALSDDQPQSLEPDDHVVQPPRPPPRPERPLFGVGSTLKSEAACKAVRQRLSLVDGPTNSTGKQPVVQQKKRNRWLRSELSSQNNQRTEDTTVLYTNSIDVSKNNPGSDFDEMKLSPFYEGYNTRALLEKWRDLPSRLTINDWAYYIRTTRRRAHRSQVDRLVGEVCAKVLSMRELMQYSLDSGAHCLLWVNSGLARRFLPRMRKGSQILGRIQGDVALKDKQNMSSLLMEHQFKEWLEWPTHVCMNEKHEIKRNMQRLCRHQYIGHYLGKCIDDEAPNCPNREYYFCECFRKHYFLPEFFTFSHYYLMEEFLKKYETDVEFKKTVWLAKPAYLTGGKGFFLVRDAKDFRYFYLVRSDGCVRREAFTLQRYLPRPCTINRCKMDCRMYLMITVLNGRRVCGFFHPGFVRTAAAPWTLKFDQMQGSNISGNVFEHLTATELYKLSNAKIPGDTEAADDQDEGKSQCYAFNEACENIATGAKKVKKGEVENVLPFSGEGESEKFQEKDFDKFHLRFKYMIEVLCARLDPIVRDKPGTFQIFGLDILIDSDTKPWLLEVNSHVATEQIFDRSQCRVISNVVTEAICIVVELFQKAFEEEAIALEIQQGEAPLAKLSRAQRMMTARAEQEHLDKLGALLEQTEISGHKPPIFMQNFFWWYDTPRYRWIKPWVSHKKRSVQPIPWYSQTFITLMKRNEAIIRKNFKADEATSSHDYQDYFRHVFWREKLESEMESFEKNELENRAAKVRKMGSGNNSDLHWSNFSSSSLRYRRTRLNHDTS